VDGRIGDVEFCAACGWRFANLSGADNMVGVRKREHSSWH
jgi:hypothetical protein